MNAQDIRPRIAAAVKDYLVRWCGDRLENIPNNPLETLGDLLCDLAHLMAWLQPIVGDESMQQMAHDFQRAGARFMDCASGQRRDTAHNGVTAEAMASIVVKIEALTDAIRTCIELPPGPLRLNQPFTWTAGQRRLVTLYAQGATAEQIGHLYRRGLLWVNNTLHHIAAKAGCPDLDSLRAWARERGFNVIKPLGQVPRLTRGQRLVLEGVARNMTTKEMAAVRGTCPRTIRAQVSALELKIGVMGNRQLADWARSHGMAV